MLPTAVAGRPRPHGVTQAVRFGRADPPARGGPVDQQQGVQERAPEFGALTGAAGSEMAQW
jgi:hypothetical protein